MKVHIFKDENVYVLSLLEFLNKHFDLSEHRFIFRCKNSGKKLPVDSSGVDYLPGISNLFKIKKIINGCQKVYFHLLPSGPDLIFWYFNRSVFKKSAWIFWGADVYAYRKQNSNIRWYINQKMRRDIIPLIPEIGGFLIGDFNIIQQVYNTKAVYKRVFYPIPTNFSLCDEILKEESFSQEHPVKILAGNSGNETNNHIEMFNILKKFKDNNINILCPLSYGAKENSYISRVIEQGRILFGNKFEPLLDFMYPLDYLRLLNTVDVAVMNHSRQQGMSSSLTLLYLGKKVFLNEDTISYKYLINNNISIFKNTEIDDLTFQEFVAFSQSDGIKNKRLLSEEFSEKNFEMYWKEFLEL
jgi:dTDP-N-acetylfucosamine:lipid II N-acetylfucosaminyltransferase